MKGFRALSVVAAIAVYGQIVLGGVVRITGSGLGCPDWPACQGHVVPDFANSRVAIEYAHRLIGTAAGLLMLATAVAAVLLYTRRPIGADTPMPRGLMGAATAGVGLIVVQGVLGGITVLLGNNPFTVAIHLGNALLVLGTALLVALWAGRVGAPDGRALGPGAAGPLSRGFVYGSVGAAFAIVVSGAYVVGAGAGAACPGWPLCGAAGGAPAAEIHLLHRAVVLFAGLVILWTLRYAARRWRRAPMAAVVYGCALVLVVEVGVGAAQVLLHLPEALRAVHLALAAAVWAAVVLMASALWLETSARVAEQPAQSAAWREAAAR
jgi:heme A synthase